MTRNQLKSDEHIIETKQRNCEVKIIGLSNV